MLYFPQPFKPIIKNPPRQICQHRENPTLLSHFWRAVYNNYHGGRATAVAGSPNAITTNSSTEQPRSQAGSTQDQEQEWELIEIASKRWVGVVEESASTYKALH